MKDEKALAAMAQRASRPPLVMQAFPLCVALHSCTSCTAASCLRCLALRISSIPRSRCLFAHHRQELHRSALAPPQALPPVKISYWIIPQMTGDSPLLATSLCFHPHLQPAGGTCRRAYLIDAGLSPDLVDARLAEVCLADTGSIMF
ncbi:hypothetical protein BGW36DRAFT_425621 [Talaromyces proteolyticus]|uniref:Uncharacterized protein n=1 Tax=Talaromyces proteolyticus TaxID=1131652 RepID=A0AAD4KVM4_9EURO|nr:uncharacterized protein BGW36DRAFT_425621 [Talaromyces proteolyticus]KAH8700816.1 hypothetical protein BGW36DRAFT_425621 [Talaromyces proteolyticus]